MTRNFLMQMPHLSTGMLALCVEQDYRHFLGEVSVRCNLRHRPSGEYVAVANSGSQCVSKANRYALLNTGKNRHSVRFT